MGECNSLFLSPFLLFFLVGEVGEASVFSHFLLHQKCKNTAFPPPPPSFPHPENAREKNERKKTNHDPFPRQIPNGDLGRCRHPAFLSLSLSLPFSSSSFFLPVLTLPTFSLLPTLFFWVSIFPLWPLSTLMQSPISPQPKSPRFRKKKKSRTPLRWIGVDAEEGVWVGE